jgi:SUF system NifU family Fe-S assembly protein
MPSGTRSTSGKESNRLEEVEDGLVDDADEMDDLYRDYILEHYRRPHNFGVIEDPTRAYEGANPLCGDRITMQLGVEDGVVERVGFTGRGCAISQASASLLTDEIKGKPVATSRRSAPTTSSTCSASTSARPG